MRSHYGQLKESEKKYDAARLKNDIEGAKKYHTDLCQF